MSRGIEPKRVECMCPLCGNAHDARDISSPSAAAMSNPSDSDRAKAREMLTAWFGGGQPLISESDYYELRDRIASALAAEREAVWREAGKYVAHFDYDMQRFTCAICSAWCESNALAVPHRYDCPARAASTATAEEPERDG